MSIRRPRIAAIILAAGESRRMGTPKALLALSGVSFVRRVVRAFQTAGVSDIFVVVGAAAEAVAAELAGVKTATVFNAQYRAGQLSSIIAGLAVAEELAPDAVFVHPVDQPLLQAATIERLAEVYAVSKASIIVPTYKGKRGHPVLFAAPLFAELKAASAEVGARSVVWAHAAEVQEVVTDDESVILNVNTPEDYAHLQPDLHRPA